MKRFLYSQEHANFIANGYKTMNINDLTKAFNSNFGLNKTSKQLKSYISRMGFKSGRTGRFHKGNIPWNRCLNSLLQNNDKENFKVFLNSHIKPIGFERVDKSGYVLVKVHERNPYTGCSTRFKFKHVLIWEKNKGPVPEGMVVFFKNGNSRDFSIDNLTLVSRSELLALNQYGYKNSPDDLKPTIIILSKLKSKIWDSTYKQ